jgi:hypothetical protein
LLLIVKHTASSGKIGGGSAVFPPAISRPILQFPSNSRLDIPKIAVNIMLGYFLVITCIPAIIFIFGFQRLIVRGLIAGSVKE